MWVFVLGDALIFTFYFVVYGVYRARSHSVFAQSQQHLSIVAGLVDTAVLLTSSLLVARAVRAARTGRFDRAIRLTLAGVCCGVAFVVLELAEWRSLLAEGMTLPRNDFYMFYYMLTGVHMAHVALGLIMLSVVVVHLRRPHPRSALVAESAGLFWHLVDVLWIAIFTVLYLAMRA